MCCCCPPAIQALFCLWIKSGFSKDTVAGALTFFPPDPPLYHFLRISKDGDVLSDDDDNDDQKDNCTDTAISEAVESQVMLGRGSSSEDSFEGVDESAPSTTTGKKPNPEEPQKSICDDHGKDGEDMNEDPSRALTKRALRLRKLALIRRERDARDAMAQVTYRLVLDPRLVRSPSFSGTISAVKIGPEKKTGNYIAAILYRQSPERETRNTRTIIYSHGNATDIGAMNFMQCVLARALHCNVVMYDYSGYGESGGIALEQSTYDDIQLVYKWVVDHVVPDKDESRIVIYGQSVGSGPSCYLCSMQQNVGGLILHSPFMSGMRVLTSNR
jgi:acetyl esterase/lipase